MTITPKIIAVDLRNATIENLDNWLLTTEYITASTTANYIRHCITTWKNNDDPIQMLFIINDVFFGHVQKARFPAVKIEDWFQDELMNFITPIKLQEIESYRSVIIDWIFNSDKTKAKTAFELRAFQKYSVEDEVMVFPHFNKCVTSIDVEELGFTLKELFVPLNQRFDEITEEFKKYYPGDNDLKRIQLTRIFIIEKYILGYSFRMENEPYEHFFWNIYFEEQLLLLGRFTFDDKKRLTLDDVLDKINLLGLEQLTETERKILIDNK